MSSPLPAGAVSAMTTVDAVRHFATGPAPATPLRAAITAACRIPEPQAVAPLLEQARLPAATAQAVQDMALQLAQQLRARKAGSGKSGLVQGLLQEFSLSSQEGIALMCLAEALLRIPDSATRDALIRDKIRDGDWQSHLGKSPSLFVNAAAWGLLLTGKLVATHSEGSLGTALAKLTSKGGEPLVRKGVDMAMRMMGEQFVTGETIGEALNNARRLEAQGFRYSYDMLGEAALTEDDAARYMQSYVDAIHAIGKASAGRGIYEGPGISIKLSALHPRYSRAQYARVMTELLPRVLQLAELARQYDIGMNIDAEEADRLEISLDLLEALCLAPSLAGWNGLGFVIQAYQKRCPFVIDHVVDLARRTGHRLMVRLVKGAYWDSEIKRAQIDGLTDYPVYTRKVHTDVSYLACARKLLAAPDAVYPSSPPTTRRPWPASTRWPNPPATSAASMNSSACTAWANHCTNRWWARWAAPAASTPRLAHTKRCWPTWCAACWKTARTARSCTALPTPCCPCTNWRFPPSPSWTSPPSTKAAWAHTTRAFPCPASSTARNAPIRKAWI